ncbi:MAG TPA: polyprenol phosphomannose-dependent alpha 1,6 mannosyltransferase MptB [Fulvivirga sp.]|nr:polyprenol phosphomannose-dependent alpha 1,6 mannosyltransferase MptB [Fulvivirga sp.]
MLKDNNRLIFTSLLISAGLYIFIAYFLERHQSIPLMSAYVALFLVYVFLITRKLTDQKFNLLLVGGIVLRLLLLVAFPNLSDDIYRFVWDGKLVGAGIHPFAELPSHYLGMGIPGIDQQLYDKLNSPDYFTIYPPLAQFIFWISTVFTDSVTISAITIRAMIIGAELGTIWVMLKLLKRYNLPRERVFLYALNPLVILELTGNLHFEAFMIFFVMLFIYYISRVNIVKAALFLAMSVASKLIPLIFIPLLIKRLSIKQVLLFSLLTGVFILLLFLPLIDYDLIKGMSSSIGLYFQKFEFNASVYYIIREIGFWQKGYNIIGTAGIYLALATFVLVLIKSISHNGKQNIANPMMWVMVIYLALATTVHPWYITTILALSVFTQYRFVVLWSFLVFFSYVGYTATGFEENLTITFIEYSLVISMAGFEVFKNIKSRRNEYQDI